MSLSSLQDIPALAAKFSGSCLVAQVSRLLYNYITMRQSRSAILEFLATSSEPITYQQIAQETGLKSPKTALSKLKKKGLVDNFGNNQWTISAKGEEQLNEQLEQSTSQPIEKPVSVVTEEIPLFMEDVFREAGELLFFMGAKNKARLDSIVYYVGKIAGFDDPVKIWDALCDLNLTPRVKYCWLQMFMAKATPWQRMPAELEEKCKEFFEEMI
ncbi:hypothetical protein ES707_12543 [subsurface metagenome]